MYYNIVYYILYIPLDKNIICKFPFPLVLAQVPRKQSLR